MNINSKSRIMKPNLLLNKGAFSFNNNNLRTSNEYNNNYFPTNIVNQSQISSIKKQYYYQNKAINQQNQIAAYSNLPKSTNERRRPLIGKITFCSLKENLSNTQKQFNSNKAAYNFNEVNSNNSNSNSYQYKNMPESSKQNENDERPLDVGNNQKHKNKFEYPKQDEATFSCPDCRRNFIQSVLDKHIKICKSVFQNKRKAFDSKKTRMVENNQEQLIQKGDAKKNNNNNTNKENDKEKDNKVPKWKKQSEEFRSIIHATNKEAGEMKNKQSVLIEDYIYCKFCKRKYNEEAYKKHCDGCERRFKDATMKGKVTKEEYNRVMGINGKNKKSKN